MANFPCIDADLLLRRPGRQPDSTGKKTVGGRATHGDRFRKILPYKRSATHLGEKPDAGPVWGRRHCLSPILKQPVKPMCSSTLGRGRGAGG